MRNPLTHMQANTSSNAQTDRPTAVEPVPERYAGDNNPYRGTESHGVESTNDPNTIEGYGERAAVVYEPVLDEPDPIPVRIVQESRRELRMLRTVIGYAAGTDAANASLLLGRDEGRRAVRIKNTNATVVYITHESMMVGNAAVMGYPLAQNEVYDSQAQSDIWASAPGGAPSLPVPMIIEYAVTLNSE